MSWQYSPLALVLAISASLLGSFTFFAWKRRHIPGIMPVLVLFAAATVWLGTSAFSLAHTDLATAISMNRLGVSRNSYHPRCVPALCTLVYRA